MKEVAICCLMLLFSMHLLTFDIHPFLNIQIQYSDQFSNGLK